MSREVIAPRGTALVRGLGPGLVRGLVLWTGLTLTAAALPVLLAAETETAWRTLAGTQAGTPFDALLAAVCAVALVVCAAWAWLVTTVTLALALAGSARRVPGCPDGVRRLVLAACGVAAVAVTVPAHAGSVDGEPGAGSPPTPEQSAAALPRPEPVVRQAAPVVRVQPGDSLWSLAEGSLPPAATDADVDRAWRSLWIANRAAVGPDPDLIHPGTLLRRPTPKEHR